MMRKALLMALLLVPGAWAADSQWQERERDVEMRQVPGGAVATSRGPEDRIDVVFEASSARLSYVFADDGTRLKLEQRVVALVEWEDRDGDGQYTVGDRTIHRTALDGTTASTSTTSEDGEHRATTHYTVLGQAADGPLEGAGAPPGRFTIEFTVLEQTVRKDGRTITPTEIPINLQIEDFPFREEGTELAFEVHIGTDRILDRAAAQPVAVSQDNHTTFYAWHDAVVENQPAPARATEMVRAPDEPSETTVYYSFAAGDAQQPTTMGTLREMPRLVDIPLPRTAGDLALFALGAVAMASLIGVPAWRRMRSR